MAVNALGDELVIIPRLERDGPVCAVPRANGISVIVLVHQKSEYFARKYKGTDSSKVYF